MQATREKKKGKKSLFSSILYQNNCRGNSYIRKFSCLKCLSLDGKYKNIIHIHLKMNGKLKKRSRTESCWEHVLDEEKGNKELGNVQSHMAGKGFFTNLALSLRLKNSR